MFSSYPRFHALFVHIRVFSSENRIFVFFGGLRFEGFLGFAGEVFPGLAHMFCSVFAEVLSGLVEGFWCAEG